MTAHASTAQAPLVLVGGYWLGPWAWADVRRLLEAAGHTVDVPVLPGLGDGTPPECVTASDQAEAVLAALAGRDSPLLVVHSGAGALASLVTDRNPAAASRVVYVDSGPVADGQVPRPDLADPASVPVPTVDELVALGPMTAGLSAAQLQEFATRGLPQPGRVVGAAVALSNPRRLEVPTTFVCCSFPGAQVQQLAGDGDPMFAPTLDLADADYVDLPGDHWPMFSQPEALADCLHRIAVRPR